MLFNVSGLLREPIGAARHYALEPAPPLHAGEVELVRLPGGVLVRCHATVFLDAECSRCVTPFSYREEIAFDEVFVQQVDVSTGRQLDAPAEPDNFLISTSHTIDITEAVRQYTEAAAEMQPLCRADCPGLCPECGQDLSVAACTCDRSPIDQRWAALARMKLTNGY